MQYYADEDSDAHLKDRGSGTQPNRDQHIQAEGDIGGQTCD